jgi:hypothetical protein
MGLPSDSVSSAVIVAQDAGLGPISAAGALIAICRHCARLADDTGAMLAAVRRPDSEPNLNEDHPKHNNRQPSCGRRLPTAFLLVGVDRVMLFGCCIDRLGLTDASARWHVQLRVAMLQGQDRR